MNFKKITIALFFSVVAFSSTTTKAQTKITEGKADFSVEIPSEGMDDQTKAMLPTEATMYFKGDKSRSEMEMSIMTMVYIFDMKDNSMLMLMDVMGKKTAMKMDLKQEMEKNNADDYKVEITKETKTIAGYNCTKAIVTGKEDTKFEVWFTKEIEARNSANMHFKGIEGFPLQYEIPMQGRDGIMKLECKSVKAEEVSDDKFTIPEGYEVKTQEEMQKQYGGGK